MRKRILIAAALSLTATAVLADMYQDAKNAELPAARQNLELGTVRSEGGDPPDTLTSFYTWGGTRPQFQVLNNPQLAAEWVAVQAGVTGGGATHLCTGYNPNVQCNYVGLGTGGHLFGNGFGNLLNLQRQGTGSIKSYFTLWGSGDDTARIDATASYYADVKLQLKAKGGAAVILRNDVGTLATFDDTGGSPDGFAFSAGNGTTFTTGSITAGFGGIQLNGQRIPVALKTTAYSVTSAEAGAHFTNRGATGSVTFTLPAAVPGNNYCFSVDAAFSVIVKANAADKIAVAAANSVAGGQVAASVPFASVCLLATQAGQWITRSTPDKAQWTVT